MPTDEEVREQQEKVARLRAELQDARSARQDKERDQANEIVMAQLQQEEEALRTELENEQRAIEASSVPVVQEPPQEIVTPQGIADVTGFTPGTAPGPTPTTVAVPPVTETVTTPPANAVTEPVRGV